jgi:hypothetical protein
LKSSVQPKAVRFAPKKDVRALHEVTPRADDSDDDSAATDALPSLPSADPSPASDFR